VCVCVSVCVCVCVLNQWNLTICHCIHDARSLLFTTEVRTGQILCSEVEVCVRAGVKTMTQRPCLVVGHERDHHLWDRHRTSVRRQLVVPSIYDTVAVVQTADTTYCMEGVM